ncbi:hypothetical protein NFI96_012093 [Prochilodus magdalenae]|nr:hypothetical protein NFI96_012093 [Prochilodus magdalenae]
MDVQQQEVTLNSGTDRTKSCENHTHHITQEHTAETEIITRQPDSLSAKITCSNGIGHRGSEESLNDIVVTSEDALLLPDHVPVLPHKIEKESFYKITVKVSKTPSPLSGLTSPDTVTKGSPPICTPNTASTSQRAPDLAQVPKCNGHSQPHKKRLPSTSKSQQSLKANATQIQQVAGDALPVLWQEVGHAPLSHVGPSPPAPRAPGACTGPCGPRPLRELAEGLTEEEEAMTHSRAVLTVQTQ